MCDVIVMPSVRHRHGPGVHYRQEVIVRPVLLTESRTAEFLDWLADAPGPVADHLRWGAHELAVRWRCSTDDVGVTKKARLFRQGRQVRQWVDCEVKDAELLSKSIKLKTKGTLTDDALALRAGAMELLQAVPNVLLLDHDEIARAIIERYSTQH